MHVRAAFVRATGFEKEISAPNASEREHGHVDSRTCDAPTAQKLTPEAPRDVPKLDPGYIPATAAPVTPPAPIAAPPAPSPRDALVRALTTAIADASAAGDLSAARVALDALGRLLAEPTGAPATVVDLASRR